MGRGRSEPVETSRGSHRCFASIFHSWILRRFLRVSPSSSGAWARGVRGPPCRCLQARRPHAHVACPRCPSLPFPCPGWEGRGAGARGRRHRPGVWPGVWAGGRIRRPASRPRGPSASLPSRDAAPWGPAVWQRGMRRGHGAGTGSSCAGTDWAETPAAQLRAGQTSRADGQTPACEWARSGRGRPWAGALLWPRALGAQSRGRGSLA